MNVDSQYSSIVFALAVGLAMIPIAAILTMLLMPLWQRIEAISSISATSGDWPAAWCFLLVYLVLAACITLFWRLDMRN